jgi:hypothetical protein
MTERVSIFAGLNSAPAFKAKPRPEKEIADEAIDQISEGSNFPSRQAVRPQKEPKRKRRLHRTGRNVSMNIKVTPATQDRFYRLADERKLVLGALLDEALTALEKNEPEKI